MELSGERSIDTLLNGTELSGTPARKDEPMVMLLSGIELRGVPAIAMLLSGTELRGTELNGTELSGMELSGTELSGLEASETPAVLNASTTAANRLFSSMPSESQV
jgi:uncharacterized protein YjbI with pentapeptide repeats